MEYKNNLEVVNHLIKLNDKYRYILLYETDIIQLIKIKIIIDKFNLEKLNKLIDYDMVKEKLKNVTAEDHTLINNFIKKYKLKIFIN